MNASNADLDVAVVGGSIAGLATAIRFRQLGHRTAIFEKKAMDDEAYKRLCTHFMQPNGVPLLAGLGVGHLREPAWSVTTKAVFVTPGGLIERPGGYLPDQPDSYALNLERRVLDPRAAGGRPRAGGQFHTGTTVAGVEENESGLDPGNGTARLDPEVAGPAGGGRGRAALVAGQGTRQPDRVASQRPGLPVRLLHRHRRPAGNRSIFTMYERDLACVYPLVGGRTLLVLFGDKSRVADWHGQEERLRQFVKYFDDLPEAPSMSHAESAVGAAGLHRLPEPDPSAGAELRSVRRRRRPVPGSHERGRLQLRAVLGRPAGQFLRRPVAGPGRPRSRPGRISPALSAVIGPHVKGICADALVGKDEGFRPKMFKTISDSPDLSQKYLAITGRLLPPDEFNQDLMRAMLTRSAAEAADGHDRTQRPRTGIRGSSRGETMPRVAFTTFAILKKPYGNPEVQEYDDLTPAAFDKAEGSPGLPRPGQGGPGAEPPDQLRPALGRVGPVQRPALLHRRPDQRDRQPCLHPVAVDRPGLGFCLRLQRIPPRPAEPAARVVPQTRVAQLRDVVGVGHHHPHLGGCLSTGWNTSTTTAPLPPHSTSAAPSAPTARRPGCARQPAPGEPSRSPPPQPSGGTKADRPTRPSLDTQRTFRDHAYLRQVGDELVLRDEPAVHAVRRRHRRAAVRLRLRQRSGTQRLQAATATRTARCFIVLAGRAFVVLGTRSARLGPGEVVYLSPFDYHEIRNDSDEPFDIISIYWEHIPNAVAALPAAPPRDRLARARRWSSARRPRPTAACTWATSRARTSGPTCWCARFAAWAASARYVTGTDDHQSHVAAVARLRGTTPVEVATGRGRRHAGDAARGRRRLRPAHPAASRPGARRPDPGAVRRGSPPRRPSRSRSARPPYCHALRAVTAPGLRTRILRPTAGNPATGRSARPAAGRTSTRTGRPAHAGSAANRPPPARNAGSGWTSTTTPTSCGSYLRIGLHLARPAGPGGPAAGRGAARLPAQPDPRDWGIGAGGRAGHRRLGRPRADLPRRRPVRAPSRVGRRGSRSSSATTTASTTRSCCRCWPSRPASPIPAQLRSSPTSSCTWTTRSSPPAAATRSGRTRRWPRRARTRSGWPCSATPRKDASPGSRRERAERSPQDPLYLRRHAVAGRLRGAGRARRRPGAGHRRLDRRAPRVLPVPHSVTEQLDGLLLPEAFSARGYVRLLESLVRRVRRVPRGGGGEAAGAGAGRGGAHQPGPGVPGGQGVRRAGLAGHAPAWPSRSGTGWACPAQPVREAHWTFLPSGTRCTPPAPESGSRCRLWPTSGRQ